MNEQATERGAAARQARCPFCQAAEGLQELKRGLRQRIPEGFWEHRAAARRESLLALRSLIDAAIARTEARPVRKATRIKVE